MTSDDLPLHGSGERGLFRYDKELGKFVLCERARSLSVAPAVIADTIPPTESLATEERRVFESRSAMRAYNKMHGYEQVSIAELEQENRRRAQQKRSREVMERRRRELNDDIQRSLMDLKYGRVALSEMEKERCRQEERKYKEYLNSQKPLKLRAR